MKRAKMPLTKTFIAVVCLLMAIPAFANYPNVGPGGVDPSSFFGNKDIDGKIKAKIAAVRVPFVANDGQMDENVSFHARTFGGTVFVTRDGKIVYTLPFRENEEKEGKLPAPPGKNMATKMARGVSLQEEFAGGRMNRVRGEGAAVTKVNYLKGRDETKWNSNVPTYEMVNLGEVYDGVDVKLRAHGNNVEKLFFVRPGADPDAIRVRIDGADAIRINETGGLEIETELGPVSFTAPLAHQEVNGKKQGVEVAYVVKGNEYGFRVGEFDKTRELVIDPLLASTFLGTDVSGDGFPIAIDQSGNVYATSTIKTMDFTATPGAYNETLNGFWDTFVLKMDSDLTTLLAFTYFGGETTDASRVLTIDQSGNVYISGFSYSTDFPTTPGAYEEGNPDSNHDVFISKLNGDLTTLLASTYLGGSGYDYVWDILVDQTGNVYICGQAYSTDFPGTPWPYYPVDGTGSGWFLSKLDSGLTTISSSIMFDCTVPAMALDQFGNVYITGSTAADDFFTTSGVFKETHSGAHDAFLLKMDSNLTNYLISTLLGGSGSDGASLLAIDQSGYVYVSGSTSSTDFPTTPSAYDKNMNNTSDLFVSKLNSDLTTLMASTYLGGGGNDYVGGLILDQSGNVYVTGSTGSTDFPTTDGAYRESKSGDSDVFISKLDGNLSALLYSTFLGGNGGDGAGPLGLDQSGNLYIAGRASASLSTTPNAYQQTHSGANDVFIAKFDLTSSVPRNLTISSTSGGSVTSPGEGTFAYVDGAVVDLVASQESGPVFIDWTGDVSTVADVNASSTTITMNGDYSITANFVANDPPTIQMMEPNGDDMADSVFSVIWSDFDADDDAVVSLYYDTDNQGEDGTLIATPLSEDGADVFSWDVSGLPEGYYYVYAVIDDGVNPPVVDYSDGTVFVSHASHFTPIWTGNPYDRMRLWVWSAAINGVDLDVNDEIGVFDAAVCVGAGLVVGPFSSQDPLLITSSKDDGSGNGFTEGEPITIKIWDASEQEESTVITAQYFDIPAGNPISPPNFTGFGDYAVELAGTINEAVTIPLTAGWNIFSSYTTPADPDMLSVLQPLFDAGLLLKASDEAGDTVHEVLGGWANTIGSLDPREGYKIKVAGNADLVIEGPPAILPVTIPLSVGWNIMGWPSSAPQNAMTVMQSHVTAGALEKVIDEKGDALLEVLGVWTNQIGDFRPGEGYVVKMSGDVDLVVDNATPRRRGPRESQTDPGSMGSAASPSRFTPVWSGMPDRRMNLWVAKVVEFKLLPGDEIGVFDGETCVGTGVVEEHISRWNMLTIRTSRDDGSGLGFVEGRPITFKIWSERKQREITNVAPMYFDISNGVPVEAPGFEGNGDYGVTLVVEEEG